MFSLLLGLNVNVCFYFNVIYNLTKYSNNIDKLKKIIKHIHQIAYRIQTSKELKKWHKKFFHLIFDQSTLLDSKNAGKKS